MKTQRRIRLSRSRRSIRRRSRRVSRKTKRGGRKKRNSRKRRVSRKKRGYPSLRKVLVRGGDVGAGPIWTGDMNVALKDEQMLEQARAEEQQKKQKEELERTGGLENSEWRKELKAIEEAAAALALKQQEQQ